MTDTPNVLMSIAQIKAALEAGIISASQADAMRAKLPEPLTGDKAVIGDEENMRFIRGFSDVFIAIGLGLLTLGIWALAGLFGGGALYILTAIIMWVLSEHFGRKKRAHLPTLILALSFLIFVQKAAGILADHDMSVALITFVAMLIYYLRFRLPFCIALMALSALYLVFNALAQIMPDTLAAHTGLFMSLSGIVLFIGAVLYDVKDTGRTTRFSDNAFWLHLAAAPLIIHGIAVMTLMKTTRVEFGFLPLSDLDRPDAVLVLLAIAVLTLVGLAINRRALIASSLGYAAIALGFLISGTGMNFGTAAALTLLLLGAAIVFLGVGWHGARRVLLKILPRTGIFAKLFPPVSDDPAKP